jgi:hypothetical protein
MQLGYVRILQIHFPHMDSHYIRESANGALTVVAASYTDNSMSEDGSDKEQHGREDACFCFRLRAGQWLNVADGKPSTNWAHNLNIYPHALERSKSGLVRHWFNTYGRSHYGHCQGGKLRDQELFSNHVNKNFS